MKKYDSLSFEIVSEPDIVRTSDQVETGKIPLLFDIDSTSSTYSLNNELLKSKNENSYKT